MTRLDVNPAAIGIVHTKIKGILLLNRRQSRILQQNDEYLGRTRTRN